MNNAYRVDIYGDIKITHVDNVVFLPKGMVQWLIGNKSRTEPDIDRSRGYFRTMQEAVEFARLNHIKRIEKQRDFLNHAIRQYEYFTSIQGAFYDTKEEINE